VYDGELDAQTLRRVLNVKDGTRADGDGEGREGERQVPIVLRCKVGWLLLLLWWCVPIVLRCKVGWWLL